MAHRSKARLMIVDDDRSLSRMLAWAFEDLGYQVTLAAHLREARAQLAHSAFDALLLDFHLPDGTASGLLVELKDYPVDLAIVLMSAAREQARCSCESWPKVRGFFAKPVSVPEVDREIQRALSAGDRSPGTGSSATCHR